MTAFLAALVSAPLSLASIGCTAQVAPSSSVETSANTSTETKTDSVITSTVSTVGQAVGVCTPLTCCFPTGAEWGTDSFQTTLKSLGCSTPRAYAERYESSEWWMFSQCPVTPALLAAVAENATVSPVYSQIAINECLYINSLTSLQVNSVFVEFDPTCSSCRSAAQ